jgi:hypothetical protein
LASILKAVTKDSGKHWLMLFTPGELINLFNKLIFSENGKPENNYSLRKSDRNCQGSGRKNLERSNEVSYVYVITCET